MQSTNSRRSKKKFALLPRSPLVCGLFNMETDIWLTEVNTGNMAVGNLHHFLPLIVKLVERDQEKRLLSLHALKEVCTSSFVCLTGLTSPRR